MKKKQKNRLVYLIGAILFIIMTYGIVDGRRASNEINKYSAYTNGQVFLIAKRRKGYYAQYEYFVKNERFKGSEKYDPDDYEVVEGMSFLVKYSSKTPRYSKLLLSEVR